MALLTKTQVDSILAELASKTDTAEHMTEMGMCIYKQIFTAHPEYIQLFSKLEGLTLDNVMQSEGIKYYGQTLARDLIEMLKAASDSTALEALLTKSGKDHSARKITKDQFVGAKPIFVGYFQGLMKKTEDKEAIEKFFGHVMPTIAEKI